MRDDFVSTGFFPNDFGRGGSVDKGAIDIFLTPPWGADSEGRPENVLASGEGVLLKS
jgi:hypothetical protein